MTTRTASEIAADLKTLAGLLDTLGMKAELGALIMLHHEIMYQYRDLVAETVELLEPPKGG